MAWNENGPGKDPWSQGPKRGPQQQPPDLDEMLKKFKARFGGGGGGGAGKGGGTAPLPSGIMGLLGALLIVLWVSSGFYQVDEQEQAVVLRFGNFTSVTGPGLRWHLPWPIEKEEIVNVTGVRSVREQATMLTRDENIVVVELSVQYRVSNVEQYLFNVEKPDDTLRHATKAAVRDVVGQSLMDAILTDGRQDVADRTKLILQERLNAYETGLVVTEVNLQQAQPPDEVQEAFADAIRAREDKERLKNEAEAYSNDRLPKAAGAAARQMAEATAYRENTVARAEGDAARFTSLVREYQKAPKVTRERLYLDAMSSVLGSTSKVLVDVDKGSPLIYLPMDQLTKAAAAAATPPYSSAQNAAPPAAAEPSRSRERAR